MYSYYFLARLTQCHSTPLRRTLQRLVLYAALLPVLFQMLKYKMHVTGLVQ